MLEIFSNPYNAVALFLACLIVVVFLFILKTEKYPYYKKEKLLTAAELKFYKVLLSAIPGHITIAVKPRLGDIITCGDKDWARGYGPKISAKHIDFVLFEKTTSKILACIELDDKSHNRPERKRRDKFLNTALKSCEVPLLRVQVQSTYNLKNLQTEIAELLA